MEEEDVSMRVRACKDVDVVEGEDGEGNEGILASVGDGHGLGRSR